jgi:hypothetical protein
MLYTQHALERRHERGINLDSKINIENIKIMPIYTQDTGCVKYLDIKNNIVYYVRNNKVVTMINTNPIQMLKYYAFGSKIDFKKLCRDNAFKTCRFGHKCKYIHLD